MQKFACSQCINIGSSLSVYAQLCSTTDAERTIEQWRDRFVFAVRSAEQLCERLSLFQARQLASEIGDILQGNDKLTFRDVGARLDSLLTVIENEARFRLYLSLSEELSKYYGAPRLFGDAVFDAFPSAREDIQDAGNCLACENSTAAVFHLMRAVEWGLRAFCVHLGFRHLKTHKKSGKITLVPVEYSEWEKILVAVQDRIDAKILKMRRGNLKQEAQSFYYPAVQDIKGIRDAWRNHVMHTRIRYNPTDAIAVFFHVERLMQNLSSRIAET